MTSQWFGDYEIVKRLKVGGMATLYLARRHGAAGFARLVALKMIHPHLVEQPSFVEMFVDEARICSQISHPNVVHVEEFGVIDGVHYLVMEYLDGCSISELLVMHQRERRVLDPELAARVIMQIAGGLHAAHETRDHDGQPLDVIHRDISPSNILLSSDGNAKLIDFGIAKARNRLSETEAGITLKGKYKYVAPEQATRSSVDRRCDLFSLGVVFWEMLTAQPLFPDDTYVALFNRLARTNVAPPSTLNPAVPVALDSIVLAMLAHDPADRPNTAAELQRWMASTIPGAANRDPSELGALAVEVRDKRAARPRSGEPGLDSNVSFSPTPRSLREATGKQRLEVDESPGLGTSSLETAPPTAPPRWPARRVQLGVAALLVIGVTAGVVMDQAGGRATARTTVAPVQLRLEAAPPPVAAPPVPVPSPPAEIGASPPPVVPPSPVIELPRPATAAATPAVARAPAPQVSPPARREPGRALVRPRLPRRTASETPVEPAPAPPSAARAARPPFSTMPFDDAANERGASADPAMTGKNMPIVPEFDH